MGNGDYNEAVVQFLSQKENLAFSLEISDAMPGIKRHLLELFWESIKRNIQSEVDCSGNWEMKADQHIINVNNNGIYIYPKGHSLLPFMLGYDGGKLFIGTRNILDRDLASANDFFLLQKKEGFKINDSFGSWKFIQTLDNSFFIQLSSNLDDIVDEVSSQLWTYASQNIDQLIQVNISLEAN